MNKKWTCPKKNGCLTTPSGGVYKDQIALLRIFERDYFILLKQNVKLDIHVFKLCHDHFLGLAAEVSCNGSLFEVFFMNGYHGNQNSRCRIQEAQGVTIEKC